MARHAAKPLMPVIALAEIRGDCPSEYQPARLVDPHEVNCLPLLHRGDPGSSDPETKQWLAFRVDERHLDRDGYCHKGMLATLADAVLSCPVWTANGCQPCVTISMSLSHEGHAVKGDLIEATTEITRKTKELIFATARFYVDDREIMSASSVWKILGDKYRFGG